MGALRVVTPAVPIDFSDRQAVHMSALHSIAQFLWREGAIFLYCVYGQNEPETKQISSLLLGSYCAWESSSTSMKTTRSPRAMYMSG